MLILGMDSTAVTASVALAEVKDGALISHSVFTVKNKMTHSENLMPMVDHILQVYGAKVSDLELLAVKLVGKVHFLEREVIRHSP